jgi:uncharacterized protein (TIGR02246 family)
MRFWIMSAFAAVSFASPVSAQQADLRQQIEQIATAYTGNFNKEDAAGIAGLYTKDGILVTLAAKIVNNGQQEITERNKALMKLGYNHDAATIDQVSPLGNDEAISAKRISLYWPGQNGSIKADGHWTALYVREGGQWKIRLLTALKSLSTGS